MPNKQVLITLRGGLVEGVFRMPDDIEYVVIDFDPGENYLFDILDGGHEKQICLECMDDKYLTLDHVYVKNEWTEGKCQVCGRKFNPYCESEEE